MKKIILYLFIILFIFQGCATTTRMTSKRGTIELGMTKAEVLSIWGEPRYRYPPEKEGSLAYNENRYEFWEYPAKAWIGNAILVAFNKNGIVTDIETLYK